jgi:type III secretory pathway component EscV
MDSRTSFIDLLLPSAAVLVVAMMILPLPMFALDALLMANLAFSLLLLLSCVYLRRPENFTSLPSILLLSTIFRLGLNISTTRKLLAEGAAPEIVSAFGHFVVGDSLVVGVEWFNSSSWQRARSE